MTKRTPRLCFVALCLLGFLSSAEGAEIVISKTNDSETPLSTEQPVKPSSPANTNQPFTAVDNKLKTRGELLYENHCRVCHESNVHIRNNRRAKSKSDIEYWVTRWSTHLALNWKKQDVIDVVNHLNSAYYKFAK